MMKIINHGAPFIIQYGKNLISGSHGATHFAKSIVKVENADKINFICCYSANGGRFSNAQMLANETGVPVIGYHGKINPLKANNTTSYGVTFYPQENKVTAQVCSSVNTILGAPIKLLLSVRNLLH
ncbi:effector protein [Providencia rustigianii]|uniref:effector protein n=1 Tax=Providencia rustigianii TaxID=158850 RepID=UPI0038B2F574